MASRSSFRRQISIMMSPPCQSSTDVFKCTHHHGPLSATRHRRRSAESCLPKSERHPYVIAAAKPVGTCHNGENSENVYVSNRRISSNAVAGSAVDQQTKTVQAHKSSFTTPQVVDYYADLGLEGYREHLGTLGQDSNADYTGEAYSIWDGTYAFGKHKNKAIFVDENACIGCQNCVHCSPKSFAIEPVHGRARVVAQWADDREKLNVAFDSCPVNCIHWVDKEDLPIMEYAMRKMDRTHVSTQSHGAGSKACNDPFAVAKEEKQKVKIVWSGPKCSWPRQR